MVVATESILKAPTACSTMEENLPVMVTGSVIWEMSAYTTKWSAD